MTKPKILTSSFWTPRIDALTDNIGRAVRSGIQMVVAAIGASTFDVLEFDWKLGLSAFGSGAVLSLLTSFVKPPTPPGGDPALDEPVADRGDIGIEQLLVIAILCVLLIYIVNRI